MDWFSVADPSFENADPDPSFENTDPDPSFENTDPDPSLEIRIRIGIGGKTCWYGFPL